MANIVYTTDGQAVQLIGTPAAGLNHDTDGNQYFFIVGGAAAYDANSGISFLASGFDVTPTEIPLTDYFDGTDYNSSALNDPYFFTRWTTGGGNPGETSFNGTTLRQVSTAGEDTNMTSATLSKTGKFCVTVKVDIHYASSLTEGRHALLRCAIGGTNYEIVRAKAVGGLAGDGFYDKPTSNNTASSVTENYYIRIIRDVSNNVKTQYSTDGVTFNTLTTYSNSGTLTSILLANVCTTGTYVDTRYEYIEANDNANGDGTGADIMVPYTAPE